MKRRYECIVIHSPVLSDAEVTEAIERFKKFLETNGASEIIVDLWGKREIAFEMNQKKHGHYAVFYFEAEPAGVPTAVEEVSDRGLIEKINGLLRIDESVLKFQTHRISESVRKFKGRLGGESSESEDNQKAA